MYFPNGKPWLFQIYVPFSFLGIPRVLYPSSEMGLDETNKAIDLRFQMLMWPQQIALEKSSHHHHIRSERTPGAIFVWLNCAVSPTRQHTRLADPWATQCVCMIRCFQKPQKKQNRGREDLPQHKRLLPSGFRKGQTFQSLWQFIKLQCLKLVTSLSIQSCIQKPGLLNSGCAKISSDGSCGYIPLSIIKTGNPQL